MSDLIAVAYESTEKAEEVRDTLIDLQKEQVISLDDAVIVTRKDDGKLKLHQSTSPTALGAAGGVLWGSLIGLLFLLPLLGALIGGAAGAAGGALTDLGVDDNFAKQLGEKLQPGTAALIVLVHSSTPDKVLPEIEKFGGHVLQTSLSNDAEQHLRDALGDKQAS